MLPIARPFSILYSNDYIFILVRGEKTRALMRKYPAHTHIYTWKNIITKKITYLHSCISLLDHVQLFDIKVNPCQQPPSPSIFVTTKISGRIFRSSAPLFAQQPFVRDTHRTFGEIERQLREGEGKEGLPSLAADEARNCILLPKGEREGRVFLPGEKLDVVPPPTRPAVS